MTTSLQFIMAKNLIYGLWLDSISPTKSPRTTTKCKQKPTFSSLKYVKKFSGLKMEFWSPNKKTVDTRLNAMQLFN